MRSVATRLGGFLFLIVAVAACCAARAQTPQGTAFTYQGELLQNNAPVNGAADMLFDLFDAPTAGNAVGPSLAFTAANGHAVQVQNGIFTVTLDFGALAFNTLVSDERYLRVTVNGNVLAPRTKIENAPYALQARTAELAYGVSNASIGAAQIITSQVQQRVSGSCAANSSIRVINADGSVSCQAGAGGTVTSISAGTGLSGGTITTSGAIAIANGGVGSTQLANGSVGALQIDASAVQARVSASCSNGQSISAIAANGTVTCQSGTPGGTTWNLAGNANAGGSFVGTTDNNPLQFRSNNVQAGLLSPSGDGGHPQDGNVMFGSATNAIAAGAYGNAIGGGAGNYTGGGYAAVGGGSANYASANYATVSGGDSNSASSPWASVAGGKQNQANNSYAAVGGGDLNQANGGESTVAGGLLNIASNYFSTIGGGASNSAAGYGATVAGGGSNGAGGDYSFAAGLGAQVRDKTAAGNANVCTNGTNCGDAGSFVWADAQGAPGGTAFTSTGANQFMVRAYGGVGINEAPPSLPQAELNIAAHSPGKTEAGIFMHQQNNAGIWLRTHDATGFNNNDANFQIQGTNGPNGTILLDLFANGDLHVYANAYKPNGGSWSNPSDARLKTNVRPLEHALDRLLALRGVSYEYLRPDAGMHPPGEHIGFIAQEVQPLFPDWVGTGRDGYLTVGPSGFEALTVESLRELRVQHDAEVDALGQQVVALEQGNAELRARIERMEARLAERRP